MDQRQLQETLADLNPAVIATDASGRVTFASPEAETLLGQEPGGTLGLDVREVLSLVDASDKAPPSHPVDEVLEHGRPAAVSATVRLVGGVERRLEVRAAALRGSKGRTAGAWLVLREIAASGGDNALYRTTFELMPVGIAIVGPDGRWLHFNDAVCRITGHGREELGRLTFGDITHPDDLERDLRGARSMLAGECDSYTSEKRYRRKDGSYAWVHLTTTAVRDTAGALSHFLSVIEDITLRKAAAELRRVHEERVGAFLDHARPLMGIVELAPDDSDILHLFGNAAAERFLGLGLRLGARRWARRERGMGAETIALWAKAFRESQKTGQPVRFAYVVDEPSGDGERVAQRWFDVSVSYIGPGEEGRAQFCYTAVDDNERRAAAAAHDESERRLRMASEAAGLGFYDYDVTRGTIHWDERLYALWGIDPHAAVDYETFLSGLHPDDVEATAAAVERALDPAGNGSYRAEYRVIPRGDGRPRWISAWGQASFQNGRPVRLLGAVQDISERKQAQELIREREEFARGVLDNLLAFVGVLNPDGTLINTNQAPLQIASIAREDVIGKPFWECFWWSYSAGIQNQLRTAVERAAAGELVRYDVQVRVADEALIWIDFQLAPLYDRAGNLTHLIPSGLDITSRKVAEEELRAKTRQLEEESRRRELFLATLGHELRNPLAAVDGALKVVESGAREPADILRMLTRHVGQLSALIDDLLEVSRIARGKITLRKTAADLVEVVQAAVESVRSNLRAKGQRLSLSLPNELRVEGDEIRLQQIVSNLLSNASKYSLEGGRVDVRVLCEDDEAFIVVEDQGRGLDQSEVEMIFEPFVQKEPGAGGLGIGLSLVRGLVELHGGSIQAASEGPGRGSVFTARIPIGEPARLEPVQRVESPPLPDSLRVLVIDDARDLADTHALLLRMRGAETQCAYTGAEGIERARAWNPQAVLVDLGLPDMTGYDVARAIRNAAGGEHLLLLAVTGFSESSIEEQVRSAGFDARLVKPVDLEALFGLLARHGAGATAPGRGPDSSP